MDIITAFDSAFAKMQERNWDNIYVLVDIHDTIFKGFYTNNDELVWTCPEACSALQALSEHPRIKLILWSSQYMATFTKYIRYLQDNGINIDHINCNPEVRSTDIQCFDRKPYFNVGIDDKFGFIPETDWKTIVSYFNNLKEQ